MEQTCLSLWTPAPDHNQSLLPLFSSRQCTQTLSLSEAPLERTLDGTVVQTRLFPRKYTSTIECNDKAPAAFDGLEVGSRVHVDCIMHLTQPIARGQDAVTLARMPALGSILLQSSGETRSLEGTGKELSITPLAEDGFITYRPRLEMVVKGFTITAQEWQLKEGWRLDLEET